MKQALFFFMSLCLIFSGCEKEDSDLNSNGGNQIGQGGNNGSGKNEIDIFSSLNYDELVYVEGGTFLMGAQYNYPPSYDWQGMQNANSFNYDSDAFFSDENPVHEVTLSSYYIGKYEVTQGLWEYVMNYSGTAADGTQLSPVGPYFHKNSPLSSREGVGANYPVYYVSYNDIVDYFLPRLKKITGKRFRLPSEAEWEYAARGGQKDEYTRTYTSLTPTGKESGIYYKYAGSNTVGDVAWNGDTNDVLHIVGRKAPNALGLYDMSGNVSEWCGDWYDVYRNDAQINPTGPESGYLRVRRGGSWDSYSYGCRVSYRVGKEPDNSFFKTLGFRLALSL